MDEKQERVEEVEDRENVEEEEAKRGTMRSEEMGG